MTIRLSGITWDHPRGHAPLAASIARYRAVRPDIEINWAVRSLRDFGELPLEGLAEKFDMIVFDHPFVGQAEAHGLLADLTPYIGPAHRVWLDEGALGATWNSYLWKGGIYGLPIDAAAQVAAWRPDLLAKVGRHPPATFQQLLRLAKDLRQHGLWVALTGCPTDIICHVLTLAANMGHPPPCPNGLVLTPEVGRTILRMLQDLVAVSHPASLSLNPIQVFDRMTSADEIAYVPYAFGYTNYARSDVPRRLCFGDIVAAGQQGSAGALLGGAGFGVTTRCQHPAEAAAYGLHLCHPEYQRTHYFDDGGQPGMLQAWTDPRCDAETHGFFSGTLRTLTSSYLRPRMPGFVHFFEEVGKQLNAYLRAPGDPDAMIKRLNDDFQDMAASAGGIR
ncbi:MAG: extracellular solute-binding protein [Cupriavidus sp.]|nr:extracellular solute-binding protein [Cupriavidus sp.]MCA3233305.1 extracellular solute-binding protein [Cupriavidus sp.]MCA3704366.1 extracellular solute-binding protein [Methylobacterium sp.]